MKRIIAFLLIAVITLSVFSSCGDDNDNPKDGAVIVSDGEGNDSAFTIEERKCTYKEKDIAILYVKNNTENEYSLTINISFFDTDGKEAAGDISKTRTVFSELETCYIFQPNTEFDRFEYLISSEKKDEPCGGGFEYKKEVTASIGPHPVDINEGYEIIRTVISFPLIVRNYFSEDMMMDGCVILFDNCGEVYGMHKFSNSVPPGGVEDYSYIQFDNEGVLWEEGPELPESLKGPLEIAYDFEYSVCD